MCRDTIIFRDCVAPGRIAMGLSLSERRALGRIGRAVSRSDPRLDSMLAAFSSFNAGEAKPRWEQLRLTPRRVLGALRPGVTAARQA
jgi:hypothetical protein